MMSMFNKTALRLISVYVAGSLLSIPAAHAAYGGGGGGSGTMLGILAGITTTEQEHMNALITRANQREGGISTSSMNTAYEIAGQIGYRFSGSIYAALFRPSFLYQASKGTGASGDFNYSVTGFTVFPILRIYPLENDFMKFFMQVGLGYGRASSTIEEGSAKVDFAGDAFGTTMGMGAEFCIVASHCISAEGNYRYLKIERNLASSVSGTFSRDATSPSISQPAVNKEVEIDDADLAVRMSGLQFLLGYTYRF